jgi:hypothetical protein
MKTKTTIKSLIAMALLCVTSTVFAQSFGPNLVVNGDFEAANLDPWVKNVNTARDINVDNLIAGAVSIRFTGKTAFSNIYQFVKIEHGARYEFGFTARIQEAVGPQGTESINRAITMALKDKTGSEGITLAATASVTTSTNTTVFFEFVNEGNYDSVMVTVWKDNGIGYADDIYVKQMFGTATSLNKTKPIKVISNRDNTLSVFSDQEISEINIYNLNGVCVVKRNVSDVQATLSLGNEKAGIYFIKASMADGSTKVLKYMLK